jgi:hypothetical protein
MRIDGDREGLGDYSMTALLQYGPWVSALVRRQVLIGGSYCTVAPFGTHVEVPLSLAPGDHATFRGIRLSLGLSHTASLDLLEDALYRAFKKGLCFVPLHNDILYYQWERQETSIYTLLPGR